MNNTEKLLSKSLPYLPLDLVEKVLIWLTYKGLKPVSEITTTRRHGNHNSNPKKIKKWLKRAGISYFSESNYPGSLHIGKDKESVRISSKILHKIDYNSEVETGVLFGFPKGSAIAYAKSRRLKLGEDPVNIVWPGYIQYLPEINSEYFSPYILYAIDGENLQNDLKTAQKWADVVRADCPVLAHWYEAEVARRLKREKKYKLKYLKRMELTRTPSSKLLQRYRHKIIKQTLINIFKDYFNDLLDEFTVASLCFLVQKEASAREDLVKIIKTGIKLYQQGKKLNIKEIVKNNREITTWYENAGR